MTASICTGGWITFLRRMDGSEDFYRGWADYKSGFGDPDREFWLGLDNLHTITNTRQYSLRADMTLLDGTEYFAEYSSFSIGKEAAKYKLNVGGFNTGSTAGDSLMDTDSATLPHWISNGMYFTTTDSDNDNSPTANCAVAAHGGWWYRDCQATNPTGQYDLTGSQDWQGVYWYTVSDSNEALKHIELKIKPA